jgi:hypothetical protein
MSENVGASTSCNPKGLHGLYRDNSPSTIPLNAIKSKDLTFNKAGYILLIAGELHTFALS